MSDLRVYSFLGALALPHYDAVARLAGAAAGLRALPADEPGLARLPELLAEPGPALLFLCGLPYVRARDAGAALEPLAAAIPLGDTEPRYVAALVARQGLAGTSAADLAGARVGLNGRDSLSGYVLPAAVLAARRPPVDLFARAVPTGSHRESLRRLVAGEIDAAPIDSTVLALAAAADPDVASLPVAERLGPAPIPPVLLLGGTPELATALRDAFTTLHRHAAGREALALGLVDRYVPIGDADYAPVRAMDAAVR